MRKTAVTFLTLLIIFSAFFAACNKIPVAFDVAVEENAHFTVIGANLQTVAPGGTVSFVLEFKNGYSYRSNDANAEFDGITLTLRNVRANRMIVVQTREKEDIGESYVEITQNGDKTTYAAYPAQGYRFAGWRDGDEDGEVLFYANFLTLDERLSLSAYFVPDGKAQFVNYHANGGVVLNSPESSVTHAFKRDVYRYPASFGALFFKTFSRDGYVPLEYNTEPDGSGEAFSLGSRVLNDGESIDLHVMWAKETDIADFLYTQENGTVRLVSYQGTAARVVIPTVIGGMPVTRIAGECFANSAVESVVLTKSLKTVEDEAFLNCMRLHTVYLCDSVLDISDKSFDGCDALENLRMVAVMPPTYTNDLVGSMVRRIELLYAERDSEKPNLLFYGGSGIFHSIDGQTLYDEFNGRYRIINCAQNVNVSGPLMLDIYSKFIRENDVMIYAPEYYHTIYSNELEMPSWIALEAFYDGWRGVDLRNYTGVFSAFCDMQTGTNMYTFPGRTEMRPLTYEDHNTELDEYFTRNYIAEPIEELHLKTATVDFAQLRLLLPNFNSVYSRAFVSAEKTLYFSYAAAYEDMFASSPIGVWSFDMFLEENVASPIVSARENHLFSLNYIYDDYMHLTSEGARINSLIYAEHLRLRLISDGKLAE